MAAVERNRRETFHLRISSAFLCLMLFQVQLTDCEVKGPLARVFRSLDSTSYETIVTISPNSSVYGPKVPLLATLSEQLHVGSVIRIQGFIPANTILFQINLCADCKEGPMHILHLHLSVRFDEHVVVRNSYVDNSWKTEERESPLGNFPFTLNQEFVLLIEVKTQGYYISVDGEHAWVFAHRAPYTTVKRLEIASDPILIWKIDYTDVEHLAEESAVSSTSDVGERHGYQLNGEIAEGMTIHLGSSSSDILEKFILDLRCECTPQNSSVSEPLSQK